MSRASVVVVALAIASSTAALAAPVSSANNFTAESYPATVSGQQVEQNKFTTSAGAVTCKSVLFSGSAAEASGDLKLSAEYKECFLGGLVGATVNMTSCFYLLHTGESLGGEKVAGTFDVECSTAGDEIDVTAGTCLIQVPAQKGLGTLTYTNTPSASPRPDVDISFNLSGVKYTESKECVKGQVETKTTTNGTYTGTATVKSSATGISADDSASTGLSSDASVAGFSID